MSFNTEIEKQRLALAIERTGASEEFFVALFAAANVPDSVSIDHAFARVRHFLAKKLLPAIYLDKEQFPFHSPAGAKDSPEGEEPESEGVAEDAAVLLESVARLRHKYSQRFGAECFISPHISFAKEIHLLKDAIETGRPYNYWPEMEDE